MLFVAPVSLRLTLAEQKKGQTTEGDGLSRVILCATCLEIPLQGELQIPRA